MTEHRAYGHQPDLPAEDEPEPDPRAQVTDAVLSWTVAELLAMAGNAATIQSLVDDNAVLRKEAADAHAELAALKKKIDRDEKELKKKTEAIAARLVAQLVKS